MPKEPRTVFVMNKSGHFFQPAEEFGELVFLTEGYVMMTNADALYRDIVGAMSNSKPDDILLLNSLNIINSIAAAVFARKHGRLNMLIFVNGEYLLRNLDIDALIN